MVAGRAAPVFAVAFSAMASRCEIHLAAGSEDEARRIAQFAIDEVRRIETKYSRYHADSIVSRINAAAGAGVVACDDETEALFAYADTLFKASGGLFDITSGVLRRAWDFRAARMPHEDELQALLRLTGWDKVERETGSIRLPQQGMEIDFGGFGKEYAADRAGATLGQHGVRHGYVNLGGDMRILGPQPDGSPWTIGIQDPRSPDRLAATIPVHSGALATSGDYERYFECDGKRYCHIVDPRSGMPVDCWRSVSVLAPLAIAAGSCSTIAMLKQSAALGFLDESGLSYLVIDSKGEMFSRRV